MTNYFKIYLSSKEGITKRIATNKAEVMLILEQAKKEGFMNYTVIKRIKQDTDVPIGYGVFSKECSVKFVENLDADWRIIGYKVVNYKKYKEDEDNER